MENNIQLFEQLNEDKSFISEERISYLIHVPPKQNDESEELPQSYNDLANMQQFLKLNKFPETQVVQESYQENLENLYHGLEQKITYASLKGVKIIAFFGIIGNNFDEEENKPELDLIHQIIVKLLSLPNILLIALSEIQSVIDNRILQRLRVKATCYLIAPTNAEYEEIKEEEEVYLQEASKCGDECKQEVIEQFQKEQSLTTLFLNHAEQFQGSEFSQFIQDFQMEQNITSIFKKQRDSIIQSFQLAQQEEIAFPDEDDLDRFIYTSKGGGSHQQINEIIEQLENISSLSQMDSIVQPSHKRRGSLLSCSSANSNIKKLQYIGQIYHNVYYTSNGDLKISKTKQNLQCIAARARGWLGFCYLFGKGRISRDEHMAKDMFDAQIMNCNSGISHLGMGEIYYYGMAGVKRNVQKAYQHYIKAIENSAMNNFELDRRAMWRIGDLYYWGEGGLKRNREEAVTVWYQRSAELNYMAANYELGLIYHLGRHDTAINHLKAIGLMRKAVKQNYKPASDYARDNNVILSPPSNENSNASSEKNHKIKASEEQSKKEEEEQKKQLDMQREMVKDNILSNYQQQEEIISNQSQSTTSQL